MPISKAEFKSALREVVSLEFSHIPQNENSINYVFSERFNKKMERLIKSQKRLYWNFVNTAAKRVAVIFVVIFTIFTAAFSVKALREPILKFIKQVYDTFVYYAYEGDTTETITKEYVITQLPEGFEQTDKIQSEATIITIYENAQGNTIEFAQTATEQHSGFFFDNENGIIYTEIIKGINIEFHETYDTRQALWLKEGYVFEITCYGDISVDTIKQIILSIK